MRFHRQNPMLVSNRNALCRRDTACVPVALAGPYDVSSSWSGPYESPSPYYHPMPYDELELGAAVGVGGDDSWIKYLTTPKYAIPIAAGLWLALIAYKYLAKGETLRFVKTKK
jgi:hypothetical protein